MNDREFLKELDSRLEENARIKKGGIPQSFQWLGSLVGLYPWQSLLGISFFLTSCVLAILSKNLVVLVERLVIIW